MRLENSRFSEFKKTSEFEAFISFSLLNAYLNFVSDSSSRGLGLIILIRMTSRLSESKPATIAKHLAVLQIFK